MKMGLYLPILTMVKEKPQNSATFNQIGLINCFRRPWAKPRAAGSGKPINFNLTNNYR